MELKQTHSENKGSFYIEIDGATAAEMTYTMAGPAKMIIDHTGVEEAFRGQDLGLKLVEYAVEYARQNELKVLPLCPFAKATIAKHKEWQDVL